MKLFLILKSVFFPQTKKESFNTSFRFICFISFHLILCPYHSEFYFPMFERLELKNRSIEIQAKKPESQCYLKSFQECFNKLLPHQSGLIWYFSQILTNNLLWQYELPQFSYVIWIVSPLANSPWLKRQACEKERPTIQLQTCSPFLQNKPLIFPVPPGSFS